MLSWVALSAVKEKAADVAMFTRKHNTINIYIQDINDKSVQIKRKNKRKEKKIN